MNDISLSDFKNICRMCMLDCHIKYTQNSVIKNIYHKLTDIHFETNAQLPEQICLKCFEKINEIHEFTVQCVRTHSSLLECLNKSKNTRIKEEQEVFKIENDENNVVSFLKIEEDFQNNENVNVGTSDDINVNCFEDDPLELTTFNIKVENLEEINDNTNLKGASSLNSSEYSCIDPTENAEKSKKPEEQSHKCDICNASFCQAANLKIHMDEHNRENPNKCVVCSKLFARQNYLKVHMRIHNNEYPFKCNECSKLFRHMGGLLVHKRIHNDELPFKCNICTKSYRHSSNLKRHILSHKYKYKCIQCSKTFENSSTLNVHMQNHYYERPYKCNICSKAFRHSSSLSCHKRIHSNVRPYKCNQCSKSFQRVRNLNVHMYTHNHERPFKCIHCSKAYRQPQGLNNHLRIVHNDK